MLSNTSKYAIRAAIYLALHTDINNKIGIRKISSDLNIPYPFLAKILQLLAKQKLLSSTKGPNGGFSIARDPYKITLYEIITIIDGKDIFEQCLISLRTCNEEEKPCPVHSRYESIRSELVKMFKEQTLGDLADKMQDEKNKIFL